MKDKRRTVATAFNEFADCFYSNSLWLDEQSKIKARDLLEQVKRLIHEYDKIPGTGFQHPPQVRDHLTQNTDWVNNWDTTHKQATSEIGKLRDEIEIEFKEILGMSDVPRRPKTNLEVQANHFIVTVLATVNRLLSWGKRNRQP